MTLKWFKSIAGLAVAAVIGACGGGGGGGGIGGTGGSNPDVSVGAITAFGSVWVNGVEFSSNGTTIKRDDNSVTQSELRVGMVARVDGSISNKTATTIVVKSAAKGRVEALPTSTQMVVMGQNVVIDSATQFENGVHPTVGDYVEVHGLVVADGVIAGGFVEKKATLDTPPFAVKGLVKNHTAGGTTFSIGALNVTLGAGAVMSDMPAGSWNGLQIEVKGATCAASPVCGTLTASKVEPEGVAGDVAKVEFEGFVTTLNADGFNLGAQKVVTTASTVYDGGVAGDVVIGTKVEVEGSVSAGVLTATKVSFRENVRIEANVAAVSLVNSNLTLVGLGGITVEVNALTRFSGAPNLAALPAGTHIEVRGRPGVGNNVVATELKSGSGNTNRVIVQAVASAVTQPNVTLLGIVINTSGIGSFKDIQDNPIPSAQFFAQAKPGTLIKVRGTLSGASVLWNDEAQLED